MKVRQKGTRSDIMKASYFVLGLLLSDITLTSGFIIESVLCCSAAAAVGVIWYAWVQWDNVLPFDPKREKTPYIYCLILWLFSSDLLCMYSYLFQVWRRI